MRDNTTSLSDSVDHPVVAVSDSSGAIFNAQGLDIPLLLAYKKKHGSVKGFPGSQEISTEELLLLPVDLLVPAALENQITTENASQIRAQFILELANGPTTPDADEVLYKRGITVIIPDILANAGGVTVSYFEWVQNLNNEKWSLDTIHQKLQVIMREAFAAVTVESTKRKCTSTYWSIAISD